MNTSEMPIGLAEGKPPGTAEPSLPVLLLLLPDAGTDCALGEIFTCEIPPGVEKFQIEVIAKHTLTGDDFIGVATLSLLQVCHCCTKLPSWGWWGRWRGGLGWPLDSKETEECIWLDNDV